MSFSHQLAATFSAEGASLLPSAACKVGAMLGLALLPGGIREAGGSHLLMTPPEGVTLGYYIPCLSLSHQDRTEGGVNQRMLKVPLQSKIANPDSVRSAQSVVWMLRSVHKTPGKMEISILQAEVLSKGWSGGKVLFGFSGSQNSFLSFLAPILLYIYPDRE